MKQLFTYIKIISISVVLSIYLFQIYLTFKISGTIGYLSKRIHNYEKRTGKKYDTRTKYEFYNDLKKNDKNITITVAPSYILEYLGKQFLADKIFPLSGFSNKKVINCNENGYFSIYESDRYGFNNPDTEWEQKEIEYVIVGDSFVHGDCVNRPNDFGSVLRNLSKKSVLNLGYAGNGPLFQYATLREYSNMNAKKFLWFYTENDLADLERDIKSEILINYFNDENFTQNLIYKHDEIDQSLDELLNKIIEIESKKRLDDKNEKNSISYKILKFITIKNIRDLFLNKFKKPHQASNEINPVFKEILIKTKKLSIKKNSELYFIYLPSFDRYGLSHDSDETQYNQIKNLVKNLNINFIDIHKDFFSKYENKLQFFPFETPGHYNKEGYRKIANFIYKNTLN